MNDAHFDSATQHVNECFPLEVFGVRLVLQGIPVSRQSFPTVRILRLLDLSGGVVPEGSSNNERPVVTVLLYYLRIAECPDSVHSSIAVNPT